MALDIAALHAKIIPFNVQQFEIGEGPEKLFGNFKLIPIELLVKADWNYKVEDAAKSEKLRANIKRNGQAENILVRLLESGFYEIVNGNHRLDEFLELGYTKVMCYDFGRISLHQAQRIAIETNETRFDSDRVKLAQTIDDIAQHFSVEDLAATMTYSEQEIVDMQNMLDFNWDQFHQEQTTTRTNSARERGKKSIEIDVPEETWNLWNQWLAKAKEIGFESEVQAFEHAIIEALRTSNEAEVGANEFVED